MSILSPQIAARLFNTPLMVAEDKAAAMLMGIGGRVVDGGVVLVGGPQNIDPAAFQPSEQRMGRLTDRLGRAYDREGRRTYDVINGVAVICVEGTLVHKGAYIGQSSGETSFQGLQTQIARAAADGEVKGVVFEIDSFGGQVAGAFETAEMIHRLSALKPTMAILTDYALSCGYLMAAPCRQIVMPETGKAGSIGVISMHANLKGALDKQGVEVTLITAGEHKADAHPTQPLAPEVFNRLKAENEATRQLFAAHVGRGRGDRLSKQAALLTEARTYMGRDAVKVGLVDAVAPANDAFSAFMKAVNRAA